jgi:hypothetical protein
MNRSLLQPLALHSNRRTFLRRGAAGLGAAALGLLLSRTAAGGSPRPFTQPQDAEGWRGVVRPLHFPQKIKRVIHLYMAGGPSHLETLDYKPQLAGMDGQPMPTSLTEGQQIAQLQGQRNNLKCMGPQHPFRPCGQSGQMISDVLPHIQTIADDICIVRSMQTEQINHDPAHTLMNTGSIINGRPSMGSWLLYGLGSECDNLPGYVVLTSAGGGQSQPIASRQWHSGFLPGRFQGVEFRSQGEPVLYAGNPPGVDLQRQQDVIAATSSLNRLANESLQDPELSARIAQYELAFRMQMSVPELVDVSNEPSSILEMYGTRGGDGTFASNCLLARRLAERGVRFIQVYHRGWDHHGGIREGIQETAGYVDRASAALVKDLKQRGMLDETLVIWGGEFGRTPMAQGSGRDHHIRGFSLWMAGGGVRGGTSYGSTDELGYAATEKPCSVHDLHATMLYQFGIDHTRLTYRFQGRDFRLTDVHGNILHELLG